MPNTTLSPGRTAFHEGDPPDLLVRPQIREDWTFISQWKFDDISSGSGLDSQNSNHLIASGSPTQVAGNRQASGVELDGVDDCFYLQWWNGSGLQNFIRTAIDNPEGTVQQASHDPHFGFYCSLYVDDFSSDKVILSKWNELGSDRELMVGINTSGGVFVQWQKTDGNIVVMNSSISDIIPSGEWFDFGWNYMGVDSTSSTTGVGWAITINNKILVESYGQGIQPTGASGVFCIGAANIGNSPSGFLKGKIEDFRWLNGSEMGIPEWNAFRSGIAPLTSYPLINDFNTYIGAHFQMNERPSGVVGHLDTYYIPERKRNLHVFGSGSQFRESSSAVVPGAGDGQWGSGIEHIGNAKNVGTAFYGRHVGQFPPNTLAPKGSHTVMFWIRPDFASTVFDPVFCGFRRLPALGGPFQTFLNNMIYSYSNHFDNGTAHSHSFNPQTTISSGVWSHIATVCNLEQNRVDIYISGLWKGTSTISSSGYWNKEVPRAASDSYFRMYWMPTNTTSHALSGILDEVLFFNYAIPSGQIVEFYNNSSGFLLPASQSSGMQGAYVDGEIITEGSGVLGGYILVGSPGTGMLGGYISGVPVYESGIQGSYIIVGTQASGIQGAYSKGYAIPTEKIGAYINRKASIGGFEGGYLRGVEPVDLDANFIAFYNIIGRDKEEFDAQIKIIKSLVSDFDAKLITYIDEKKPLVSIIEPSTHQSGTTVPITYTFEANASGLQGKDIYRTFWFFSDDTSTSGSTITSSGTYQTTHTFGQSGIFNAIFVAVDSKGIINSDRRIINTASGITLPTITLNATPESGIVPLSVAFSGIINTAPYEIVDKYIYFGDGTRSASTNSIYKLYSVIGCYIPVFRVRDKFGYIVTDSKIVGVSN